MPNKPFPAQVASGLSILSQRQMESEQHVHVGEACVHACLQARWCAGVQLHVCGGQRLMADVFLSHLNFTF